MEKKYTLLTRPLGGATCWSQRETEELTIQLACRTDRDGFHCPWWLILWGEFTKEQVQAVIPTRPDFTVEIKTLAELKALPDLWEIVKGLR